MRVTKKSQYGLRTMIYLAKALNQKRVCSLKEISSKEHIPFDFLEKVVRELRKAGLVKSKKGLYGGYFLAKSPRKITAGEIIKILEKNILPIECKTCPVAKKCSMKRVWKEIKNSLNTLLNSITLEDLAKRKK